MEIYKKKIFKNAMDPAYLQPGYKLPALKDLGEGEKFHIAEILTVDQPFIYVHFIGYNIRTDTLIHISKCDLTKVEVRKKKVNLNLKKNIKNLIFNGWSIETWYFSPFPKIFENQNIYICKFCLCYFSKKDFIPHHCTIRHPPGKEIWRNTENGECSICIRNIQHTCTTYTCKNAQIHSIFEVDGYRFNNYCKNISLISKCFLDHKTLYYNCDSFNYYILCRLEQDGFIFVGYFSKEKISMMNYNLACVLVLPHEQKRGYGKMIIGFSYLLSNDDRKIETCEKPFSDLGLLSYISYWKDAILEYIMVNEKNSTSIYELSHATGIRMEDIVHTLIRMKILKIENDNIIFVVPSKFERRILFKRSALKYRGNIFCISKYFTLK